jgi:hypothetical protein
LDVYIQRKWLKGFTPLDKFMSKLRNPKTTTKILDQIKDIHRILRSEGLTGLRISSEHLFICEDSLALKLARLPETPPPVTIDNSTPGLDDVLSQSVFHIAEELLQPQDSQSMNPTDKRQIDSTQKI